MERKLTAILCADVYGYSRLMGQDEKDTHISKELGVKYLLEGSVRKGGDQVRITVQLADGTTGGEVWAERYDRPFRDIFALQDDIVRRIVTTLNCAGGGCRSAKT